MRGLPQVVIGKTCKKIFIYAAQKKVEISFGVQKMGILWPKTAKLHQKTSKKHSSSDCEIHRRFLCDRSLYRSSLALLYFPETASLPELFQVFCPKRKGIQILSPFRYRRFGVRQKILGPVQVSNFVTAYRRFFTYNLGSWSGRLMAKPCE